MPVNSFENYPMSWNPNISKCSKPIYVSLAKHLKDDIDNGTLSPGTKLPPQRELADFLDINLSTVTRAFKLCEQRGLICSIVGNGTYISSDAISNTKLLLNPPDTKVIEMGAILPDIKINTLITKFFKNIVNEPDFYKLFQYGLPEGDELQNKAAIKWLQKYNFETNSDNLIFSLGGQNALTAILAALFKSGDKIGTLPLIYPGLKVSCKLLGIQLIPLNTKNNEITKESLMYSYKNEKIKGLYLIPDINNPTTDIMDDNTRKVIAEFAREVNIPIIEDCEYSLLIPETITPIANYAKEQTILISSISKTISPGLRYGIIHSPNKYKSKISDSLYAMNICVSPILAHLASRLIISEEADIILTKRQEKMYKRNEIINKILGNYTIHGSMYSPFRWLVLPNNYSAPKFEKLAFNHGVQVYSADRFILGNSPIPNAIRIAIPTAVTDSEYIKGLNILKKLLVSI